MSKKKWGYPLTAILASTLLLYGAGRVYYRTTGGFTEGNITYEELSYDSRWESSLLSSKEKYDLQSILAQEYYYLGKGCQSYVFSSKDDQYVIKFFKYQRLRPQFWLDYVSWIPGMEKYREKKIAQKTKKRETAFASWKLAYEELKEECGVCYIHLNKGKEWMSDLILYDKLGVKHTLKIDNLEFMVQKKGEMLCDVIISYKEKDDFAKGKALIDRLIALILSEYERGYADNDHALMQNTGVVGSMPIHIDVGQFVKNRIVKQPEIYRQEFFSKMWKFRYWLKREYPELGKYLDSRVEEIVGPPFSTMEPQLNKGDVARIPFE